MSGIIDIPVIVIGGGSCGLTLSSFLSDYGVNHVLFERHSSTSILPKAHYLNQRTMEILRLHKMADEIIKRGAPLKNFSRVAWATSLGGDEPLDRRVIHKFACFGGDDGSAKAESYKRDAPLRSANLPLVRLEPIFKKLASKRNPGKILFDHTVTEIEDNGNSVEVIVRDGEGRESKYRCQYLVGADGGRFVGSKIGVTMEGAKGIVDMVSVHFTADLSEYWDDRFFACHFINGSGETVFESGAIVPMGPTWGRHSEEWVFHFGFDLNDENRFNEEKFVFRIRELLKIPDLEMKVHKISHWVLERVLADKYQVGRVFLMGDAAHRRPPTTGLGLNTSIEDGLNLAWKLALVLKGKASPGLLQTYEAERQPVGRRNCDWGLFTFKNSSVINAAIGLVPGQKDANKKSFMSLFEDSTIGRSRRAQAARIIESQCIEFSAHDIELGFQYEYGCLVPDGSEAPESDALGQIYVPTTRPGHRLPHAWMEDQQTGEFVSTHDLVGTEGAFLLITDAQGHDWIAAAQGCSSRLGVTINSIQIGAHGAGRDMLDYEEQWEKVKGMKSGGAVLIRPDNFVAWRSLTRSSRGGSEVVQAMSYLLQGAGKTATPCHEALCVNGYRHGLEKSTLVS